MTNLPSGGDRAPQFPALDLELPADVERAMAGIVDTASAEALKWLDCLAEGTGGMMEAIAQNPFLKWLSRRFGTDWLMALLGEVDMAAAAAKVAALQQKYPRETPNQIAHRIMVEKAISAAGIGLATNLIPPIAAALFAVELATTARLQAETIYQVAAAYGLDLKSPARRGEVLAIFGLSLGGSNALKLGLSWVEIIPGLGAIVGASSNAVMLYALGYAACRFYEAKLDPEARPLTAETFRKENEIYLENLGLQKTIMERILVCQIRASYPDRTPEELIAELRNSRLTDQSIAAISDDLEHAQTLPELLAQLHADFAPPLLIQCYHVAISDGTITPEERQILDAIATRFDLDLESLKTDRLPT